MSNLLQTHNYDGKWKSRKQEIFSKDDELFANYPKETIFPKRELEDFVNLFSDERHKASALRFLTVLENPRNNHDPANDVNATEILTRIWRRMEFQNPRKIENDEQLKLIYKPPENCENITEFARESFETLARSLCEQIADIQNGSCMQGRTTRLFQILSSFYE